MPRVLRSDYAFHRFSFAILLDGCQGWWLGWRMAERQKAWSLNGSWRKATHKTGTAMNWYTSEEETVYLGSYL